MLDPNGYFMGTLHIWDVSVHFAPSYEHPLKPFDVSDHIQIKQWLLGQKALSIEGESITWTRLRYSQVVLQNSSD